MADEHDLTEQARQEQEGVQQWVVSAYRTVFHAGVAILRGMGLPADETARAFVTGAITFAEQICRHPQMPDHMVDRTLDDAQKSLEDGLQAIGILREQVAEARRERDAALSPAASPTANALDDPTDTDVADAAADAATRTVVPFVRDPDPGDDSGGSSNGNGGGTGTPPITH